MLNKIESAMQRLEQFLGWLTFLIVVLVFVQVLLRYALPPVGLQLGFIAMQEAVMLLHSCVFLLGVAVALRCNQHVRVDIVHTRLSSHGKIIAELVGTLFFLLPFCVFLIYISFDYVAASWVSGEGSKESAGLPGVYLWKTLIPLCGGLLLMQGLSIVFQQWRALRNGKKQNGEQTASYKGNAP